MKDQLYDKLMLGVLNYSGYFCIASHFKSVFVLLEHITFGILILACNSFTRDACRGLTPWDFLPEKVKIFFYLVCSESAAMV